MKYRLLYSIILLFSLNCIIKDALASNFMSRHFSINCSDRQFLKDNPSHILQCAKTVLANTPLSYNFITETKDINYTKYTYQLNSIVWPDLKTNKNIEDLITPNSWRNLVEIYIPNTQLNSNLVHQSALLYIDGGINWQESSESITNNENSKIFNSILDQMGKDTILVNLKYVPNQYLQINGKSKKEDAIIAYTWNKFIQDPETYTYYPLHLAMSVAASQSMNLVQDVLATKKINIQNFIVSGASKRGWTTWMTLLDDKRVQGIIPLVNDILNTESQINKIYQIYGQHWPIALNDYYVEKIPEFAKPDNALYANYLKLMQVEDPYAYFNEHHYRHKIAISSKYIINASGDDFFPPDASSLYYDDIPGDKILLYIPNSAHSIGSSDYLPKLAKAISAFYSRLSHHVTLPKLIIEKDRYKRTGNLKLIIDEVPQSATLWVAQNQITRDFRYACGIRYVPIALKVSKHFMLLHFNKPPVGWNAQFIELNYKDGLSISTPIFINPDTFPTKTQTMPQKGSCLLIN